MSLLDRFKAGVFKTAWSMGYEIRRRAPAVENPWNLETDPAYADTIRAVSEFTMTRPTKIAALVDAVRYVSRAKIPGAIVECGVWRGGSMMAAARLLMELGDIRDIYLFDTFAGMTPPTVADVDERGVPAEHEFRASQRDGHNVWCYASLEDVQRNLYSTGYPRERIHFVKGDVLATLPHPDIHDLAILRLDTDWYESTMHELKELYPKLSAGGVLIIDDYGYWKGCRQAVDEYFGASGPLLVRIEPVGKIAVKTAQGPPSRS